MFQFCLPYCLRDYDNITKEELGRATWTFLHVLASRYNPTSSGTVDIKSRINDFFWILADIYPCDDCRKHFKSLIEQNPPIKYLDSREDFILWMCEIHNNVNALLKKPIVNCSNEMNPGSCGCEGRKHRCGLARVPIIKE